MTEQKCLWSFSLHVFLFVAIGRQTACLWVFEGLWATCDPDLRRQHVPWPGDAFGSVSVFVEIRKA